jgi:hypothetical protein
MGRAETLAVFAEVYMGGMTAVLRWGVRTYFTARTGGWVGDVGNIVFLGEESGGTVVFFKHICCLLGESVAARHGDSEAWNFLGVDVTMTETFFFGVLGDVIIVSFR